MKRITLVTLLLSVAHLYLMAQVGLKDAYRDCFSIGVAVNVTNVTTPRQESLIRRNFNSVTAEDDMKPIVVHPSENVWDWSKADVIANFCRKNGIKLRGHVLAWHSRFCDWMFVDANGNAVTKEKFYERLRTHIHTVMNRYKDVVYAWDVVNEAIAEDEGQSDLATCPYRKSKMFLLCGEEYIAKAFEFAHEVDSNALLVFNDYNTVNPGKRERMYQVVKKMIDAGVPITCIGMQGHYNVNIPDEKELDATISKFSTLVKHIQITELDLSCLKTKGSTLTESEKQAQSRIFSMYFKVFRKHKDVIDNVTFWNLYDRESWIGYYNCPLLFDYSLNEKDAYYAVRDYSKSNASDPLITARLDFKNSKTYLNSYADYLDGEGFTGLGLYLRNYLKGFTPPQEKADAYKSASADLRNTCKKVQSIADSYLEIINERNNLVAFAGKTEYPGYSALLAALGTVIPDRQAISGKESLTPVRPALRLAKRDYLYSQQLKTGGSIAISKMIDSPWFCEEEAEPVSVSQGIANYYVDWPNVYTKSDGWVNSVSPSIIGSSQCEAGYYQGRTAWMSRHTSEVAGGELAICQTVTDLPEGFYSASADLITDEDPTDTHVYIKSGNGMASKSPVLSGKRWNAMGTNLGIWETLSTDVVYIGKGDTLQIGAKSTTDGKSGNGSFYATNFQLLYHDSDISGELEKATEKLDLLIDSLMLKGDIRNASERRNLILDSGESGPVKLIGITALADEVKRWIEIEYGFCAIKNLEEKLSVITDERLSKVAVEMGCELNAIWNADTTTYRCLPDIDSECTVFFLYADVVSYAQEWENTDVRKLLDSQLADLSVSTLTNELLLGNTLALKSAMTEAMESEQAITSLPLDVTFLLDNPSFSYGNSSWRGNQPAVSSGCAEFINHKGADMFQVLCGVPKGKYLLEADGFYRDGLSRDAYGRYPKNSVKNSRIYLNNVSQYLLPWASASNTKPYSDDDWSFNGVFYYPAALASAACYLRDGYYRNSVECQIGGNELIVGLSKPLNVQSDWTVCDDFRLYYLGDDGSASDDSYYVTVGEKGNTSYPYWTKFSDYYTVKDGCTAHFRFVNYSDMVNTWDNWIMAVTNRPDHNTGLYSDYREFFIIRADAYGWGDCFSTGTVSHDFDMSTFRKDMNGAFVDIYLTYKDGQSDMVSTITTNAENPDSQWRKEYHYSLQNVSGVSGDQVYVYFSVEKANLQGFNPVVTGMEDDVITEIRPAGNDARYSITGIPVDDSYRGIVIKNGKKNLIR